MQASRKDGDPLCAINWLYLFGVAHALHVGRSNARAGEGLSWVLPVAGQDLTLQVGAQRLNVVASDREKTERINVMQIVRFFFFLQSNWPSCFMLVKALSIVHTEAAAKNKNAPKQGGD